MIRALLILALLAACAEPKPRRAPSPPAPERTLIEAEPAQSRCRIVGANGRHDARQVPFTIDPRALGFPIEVTCIAEGYFETTEILHPRPQPRLLDALARRERLTIMADMAPAAGAAETSLVHFRLVVKPRFAFFETSEERDAFYEVVRQERAARWQEASALAVKQCEAPETSRDGASSNSPPEICRRAYQSLAEQRDADLRQVEIDRRRATFR